MDLFLSISWGGGGGGRMDTLDKHNKRLTLKINLKLVYTMDHEGVLGQSKSDGWMLNSCRDNFGLH